MNILKAHTLTTIEVSTDFTTRLQELLIWLISNQAPDEIKKVNEKILAGHELTQDWEHHYFTMLALINDLEEAAKAQNNTETVEVPDLEKSSDTTS